MNICILGQNLTSLALAKALLRIGLNVDLVSKGKIENYSKSRTLGISKSNIEKFNKNICNINKLSWKITDIRILSDNNLDRDLFSFKDKEYLFSIVRNYELQEKLRKSLQKEKKFKVVKFLKEKKYDLIINSDYKSSITKKYFYKKFEKQYNSYAYTTVLKHKNIKNNQAIQIFTKNGPIAFLPISNSETSIVYSLNNKKKIDRKGFVKLIKNYNKKLNIIRVNEINHFPLKASNLRNYYHKNILAFGDLLHRIHPLAGQGFNMTIRDIHKLVVLISNRINLGLPIDKSINYEFEKYTKSKNYLFSNGIDFIYEFFNFERKLNNKFLNQSISHFVKNKKLNNVFKSFADMGDLN